MPSEFGCFAYASLDETVVHDSYGFPWEYVVVPAVLLILNALLLLLATRRGWLHRSVRRSWCLTRGSTRRC